MIATSIVALTLPYPLPPTIHIPSANTTPSVAVLLLRLPLFSTPVQRYVWFVTADRFVSPTKLHNLAACACTGFLHLWWICLLVCVLSYVTRL